ncbi:hypothetical protein Tco_1220361 [Tanacetum coccineum]
MKDFEMDAAQQALLKVLNPLYETTHNAKIAQENQMEPWDKRSTMNGGSHTQVGSDYPLSLKRESLSLDRLLQRVSGVSSSGLSFYGRAHELPTTCSPALGIDSSFFVTQVAQRMQILVVYAEDIIGLGERIFNIFIAQVVLFLPFKRAKVTTL